MGGTPCIGMVAPWIGTRLHGHEAVDPVMVGLTTSDTKEVRIERARPLIALMHVASSSISLPDLYQCVGNGVSACIKDATGYDDTLTNGFTTSTSVTGQVSIFRGDGTDHRSGTSQFREREGNINEWQARGALDR